MKSSITDNPEHIERVLLRPLIENFCNNYMYKNNMETFTIKTVEYSKITQFGKAEVYFIISSTKYLHLVLRIPIRKKSIDGVIQIVIEDPVIEILDHESPKKRH